MRNDITLSLLIHIMKLYFAKKNPTSNNSNLQTQVCKSSFFKI